MRVIIKGISVFVKKVFGEIRGVLGVEYLLLVSR